MRTVRTPGPYLADYGYPGELVPLDADRFVDCPGRTAGVVRGARFGPRGGGVRIFLHRPTTNSTNLTGSSSPYTCAQPPRVHHHLTVDHNRPETVVDTSEYSGEVVRH